MMAATDPEPLWSRLAAFKGEIAFDIGANVGQASQVLAKNFSKVYAFEPCIESFEALLKVSQQYPNIIPYNIAVSSKSGFVELLIREHPIKSGQLVSLMGPDWGALLGKRLVPALTLDDLMDALGTPGFIKIDTEGHEYEVLKGGRRVLAKNPSLYIEIHAAELGERIMELLSEFYQKGIEVIRHPHYTPYSPEWLNHFFIIGVLRPQ